MKSIHDTRRDNLRALIDERFDGSQTQFAKAVGLNQPSFVSRLLTDREPTRKNIGNRLARRVEAALGLTTNWLDTPTTAVAARVSRVERRYGDIRFLKLGYEVTPERARELEAKREIESRRVPLLSPDELGQFDSIASVYEAEPKVRKVTVQTTTVPHAVAMRLADDAMGERFPAGTVVVFVDTKSPQANDFVVGVLPGADAAGMWQWTEALDRQFLVPLNRAYHATEVTPDFHLLGVVVETVLFF